MRLTDPVFLPFLSHNGGRTGFSQKLKCQFDYSGDHIIEVSMKAGCLNYAVEKKPSIPLIFPVMNWTPKR